MKTSALLISLLFSISANGQVSYSTINELKIKTDSINTLLEMANSADPWEEYEKIDSCNNLVVHLLMEIMNNDAYDAINFSSMINTEQTASEDKSIIIHNFYSNNGGTFKMHYNILEHYYKGDRTAVLLTGTPQCGSSGYYYNVEKIAGENGRCLYLLLSETIGCSTCFSQEASVIETNGNEINLTYEGFIGEDREHKICFEIYTRDYENMRFDFDSVQQVVTYSYVPEDYAEVQTQEVISGKWKFGGNRFTVVK